MKVKGYTLIEIIVVIAIIAIVTGVGLAYYNQFSEEKKLEAEVEKFVDVLNLARQKAIAGEEAINNSTGLPLCNNYIEDPNHPRGFGGYRLRFATTWPSTENTEYWLRICCAIDCWAGTGVAPAYWTPLQDIQHYYLPANIKFIYNAYANVTFISLYGTVLDNANRTLYFKNTAMTPNKCYEVTISASGVINSNKLSSCPP